MQCICNLRFANSNLSVFATLMPCYVSVIFDFANSNLSVLATLMLCYVSVIFDLLISSLILVIISDIIFSSVHVLFHISFRLCEEIIMYHIIIQHSHLSAGPHESVTFPNDIILVVIQIQNLPLHFNCSTTCQWVNSPQLWFNVILDFVHVINYQHYIIFIFAYIYNRR